MKDLVCLATVLAVMSAAAPAQSAPLEKWDFGHLAYGSKVAQKPSWAKAWTCNEDGGCTFLDAAGVEYLTWDDEVVIKRFELKSRGRYPVPFGIRYGDSANAIVKAVEARSGLHMTCDTHKGNANIPEGELYCSAPLSKTSDDTSLDLTFDKNGHLKKIEIFTDYT